MDIHSNPQTGGPETAETPAGEAGGQRGGAFPGRSQDHLLIGHVIEIAGAGSKLLLDMANIVRLAESGDAASAMAGQVGSQVKIRVGQRWLIAAIRTQKLTGGGGEAAIAHVDFIGEGDEERLTGRIYGFRRGITNFPTAGAPVYALTDADLHQVYATDERPHIEIGTVFPTRDIRGAVYVDAFLGKHFALLGSTGTGKSTAAALILHKICSIAPEGHVVMIDPHGEYGSAFGDMGERFDASNLELPYWLMNFDEHCEAFLTSNGDARQIDRDILARCLLQARSKGHLGQSIGRLTVDSPIPYLLSDLLGILNNEMGKLDKASSTAPYLRLKSKIEEMKNDPRYSFMFSGMMVADTMAPFLARMFRLPAEGRPISVIDVSRIPNDIVSTVVAVLSRMIFDYAVWSRAEPQRPILLVCEEAHRYIPADSKADRGAVRATLERIAKEGRKYGVALGLVTQRPSDLAEGVLSQCGTIISMRLNNERDQAYVRAAMPEGARGFLDSIPALRNRECIICGEGVSVPVRLQLDNLEESKRPASDDPLFSELWHNRGGEPEIIERVVKRWRSQGR